jgi:DNA-binding Lrp family transcriptional regulator
MPIDLTDYDIAVLNTLLKDGRKSFRQISRETEISTPTVKTRFDRLINMGVIKSIIPIVDFDKVLSYALKKDSSTAQHSITNRKKYFDLKSAKRVTVNLNCNYCNTPLLGKIYTFKFASLERFFCCKECRTAYEKRYAARIRAITERYYKAKRKSMSRR